jgi:hypothetical protein
MSRKEDIQKSGKERKEQTNVSERKKLGYGRRSADEAKQPIGCFNKPNE